MVTLVLRQTHVSREFALAPIRLLAQHPINVTTPALVIPALASVRIRRKRMAPRATMAIFAPLTTVVRAEFAKEELRTQLVTGKSPLRAIG